MFLFNRRFRRSTIAKLFPFLMTFILLVIYGFFLSIVPPVTAALDTGTLEVPDIRQTTHQQDNSSEDEYHRWFRQEISETYGLTNGRWIFSDNEQDQMDVLIAKDITPTEFVTVTGQPFRRGIEVQIDEPTAYLTEAHAINLSITTRTPITKGETIVLVVWVRNPDPESEAGFINFKFQQRYEPWRHSLQVPARIPPDDEWHPFIMPALVMTSSVTGDAELMLALGATVQRLQIGGLAGLNFGKDHSWRDIADERIERHRKGDLNIMVQDAEGQPISDATVHVQMREHEFRFGTAVKASQIIMPNPLTYTEKLLDLDGEGHRFNTVVLENDLKWPVWGDPSDTPTITKTQIVSAVRWLRDHDFSVRGHTLVWGNWRNMPSDLQEHQNDPDYLKSRVQNHITEEVGYPGIKGELLDWDVVNEPQDNYQLAEAIGGEEVYAEWFTLTHETDPDALLFLNEKDYLNSVSNKKDPLIPYQESVRERIKFLLDQGAPLDGIGIQAHIHRFLPAPQRIYEALDELAVDDEIQIRITEHDILQGKLNLTDEEAADYMDIFLKTTFSHPSVTGFMTWGFWDRVHHQNNAPFFDDDWNLKPAGEKYIDLVFKEWWTDKSGYTESDGRYTTRGFLGQYEITVSDGTITKTIPLTLTKEGINMTVRLAPTETSVLSASVTLQGGPAPPHPRWVVPLRVSLTVPGEDTPVYEFEPTTDENGHFTLTGIEAGTYEIRVKHAHTLQNMQTVTLTGGSNTIDFGELREGDANDDNFINILDFSILAATFGICEGTDDYDERADFNGDDCILINDFSLLATNFGQGGENAPMTPNRASDVAATDVVMSIEPAESTIQPGDTFNVTVRLDAGSQQVDGTQIGLNFDPAMLAVEEVMTGDKLALELANQFDNEAGTIQFAAGTLEEFPSGVIDVLDIQFRALQAGETTLAFDATADGAMGSNVTFAGASVLGELADGVVTVNEPTAVSIQELAAPATTGWLWVVAPLGMMMLAGAFMMRRRQKH